MYRYVLLPVLLIPLLASAQVADTTTTQRPTPTTKIEAFSARTGIVVIKGFTPVGKILGQGTGSVSVDAREFRDGSNPNLAEYGVAIEVKESGRLERESRSFVDQDEIDSLIRGMDYISKITKSVTTMKDFEAEYRTKGDFSITVFSNSGGSLGLAVSSGRIGRASAYLKVSDLEQLRSLLIEAKKMIDTAKAVVR